MKKIILGLSLVISLFASVESRIDEIRYKIGNGTLLDTWSNLEWQYNEDILKIKKQWLTTKNYKICNDKLQNIKECYDTSGDTADTYCKNLNLNGKNDWRLPSLIESYQLYILFKKEQILNSLELWTKHTYIDNSIYADFQTHNGKDVAFKNKKLNVMCVRGKRYGSSETKYNNQEIKIFYKKISNIETKVRQKLDNKLWNKALNINTTEGYYKYLDEYNNTYRVHRDNSQAKVAQQKIYELIYKKVLKINTIKAYSDFIKKNQKAPQVKNAQQNIYELAYKKAKNKNTLQSFNNFTNNYSKAPQKKQAVENIYKLTKQQNNISGYEWFISKYPNAPQVKEAIKNIHKLAFTKVKEINTISAYNTFIIAYPYASQVKDSNAKAYNLESLKYKRMKKDDEKKARLLAVKIKKLTIAMKRKSNKDGYIIVKDRMIKLLTEQYEETDASLRYYESKEFTDFTNTFENVMSNISRKLGNIERYSSEILSTSKQGFEDAKADRAMSRYKSEEHTKWEKRMHFREKGYN